MRIAVIGPIYPDSFAKCIVVTLREMGHTVLSISQGGLISSHIKGAFHKRYFSYLKSFESILLKSFGRCEQYAWKKAIRQVREFGPELILSVQWDLPPNILESMKEKAGSEPLMVLWCPDSWVNFSRQYIFVSPWDHIFLKDEYIIKVFKKIGLNAHLLAEACHPSWHKKVDLTDKEKGYYGCDITTVGNLYPYRVKIFENLIGYEIKVWGSPPSRHIKSPVCGFYQRRHVTELEKSKAFNGAVIVLNTLHYGEVLSLNTRAFEICGCGGFQILDASPVVENYFIPGKEVVCFKDVKELKELIPYYLNRPKEREEIAFMGYLRAHSEHTFHRRLEKLFKIIFNDE